jgi:hypothetical protein
MRPRRGAAASSSSSPSPCCPPQQRRPQQELLAEVAASAPATTTTPTHSQRRDAGFFARRAAALESLLPGLVEGGALHALTPHEARDLLDQGVGEGGSSAAARLVRLSAAVPSGVDVGEMVRRCPRLLMVVAEVEEAGGSERAAVERLRAIVAAASAFDNTDAAIAELLREHPELLLPSVAGSRRALEAKLALLERGLAARRARCGLVVGGGVSAADEDAEDADSDDPTRSAHALAAACPSLLARDEPALAAVLAEIAEVDGALMQEGAAAAAAAAAAHLHGRVLAARPGLLRHYGRGGRSGRGGRVLEAVQDGPERLELPSAADFLALLGRQPEALEAMLPSGR